MTICFRIEQLYNVVQREKSFSLKIGNPGFACDRPLQIKRPLKPKVSGGSFSSLKTVKCKN